jgi:predicted nucleotidyltransferase
MMQLAIKIDRTELASFCRKYGVARLSLFGSILRSDYDPSRSDVDVLVEFQPGAHKGLFKLLEMQRQLADLFEKEVDLTTPGSLSEYFRADVLASSQVLYDAA